MKIIAKLIDGKLAGYQRVSDGYPEDKKDPTNAYVEAKSWAKGDKTKKVKIIKEKEWNTEDYELYVPLKKETKLEELERRIVALENK